MINPAMESRKQRLEAIRKILEKIIPVDYARALAIVMTNSGAKEQTAREYLRTVMLFNGWKLTLENKIVKDELVLTETKETI